VKIDSEKNDFIVEELDDQTLVIKEGMLQILKMRLNDVPLLLYFIPMSPDHLLSSPYSPAPYAHPYWPTQDHQPYFIHRPEQLSSGLSEPLRAPHKESQ